MLSDIMEALFKIKNVLPVPLAKLSFPAQSHLSGNHISVVLYALSLHSILVSSQMESAKEM